MGKTNALLFLLIISLTPVHGAVWTPSTVLEPNHPRILFTSADSADFIARVTDPDFSGYYSGVWSRANATSGNSTQLEDMNRSAIAVSAAMVLYTGVKPGGDTLTTSERSTLESKCIDYLNNLITTMGSRLYNSEYHNPCERLIQYSIALDILLGAGVAAPSNRVRDLANTIYDNATYYITSYLIDDIILLVNHKLIVAGALGTAAVVLPEDGGEWIDYAMTKIDHTVFTLETSRGSITGFAEGPHYFKYSMEHLIAFFVGMRNYTGDISDFYDDPCGGEESGNIRAMWFDPDWDNLYYWISEIRLPNGTIPPLDDSFRGGGFCHSAFFAERDSSFYWVTPGGGSKLKMTPFLFAAGAHPAGQHAPGLTCLPDAGNLIFRTDSTKGDIYVHFMGEHDVANIWIHNHADEASFFLYAYGEDLALDPGYIQYDERGRVSEADNHNCILVDGNGASTLSPVDCYISDAFELPGLCFGEVATNYQSADIRRHCALLGERFVVIIDHLSSGSSRDFSFQCHGIGLQSSGTFESRPHGGIWSEDSPAKLELLVDAVGGLDALNIETEVHETGYLFWADHTVLRAHKTATATKFCSVLFPFGADGFEMRSSLPVIADQSTVRFGAFGLKCIAMTRTNSGSLNFAGDFEFPTITCNGEAAIMAVDSVSDSIITLYAMNCDSILFDGNRIFYAPSGAVDLGLSYCEDNIIKGYLNGLAATVVLDLEYEPVSVVGALSWSWSSGELTLNFEDYARFTIDITPHSVPLHRLPGDFNISAYPNPFNSAVTISVASVGATDGRPGQVGVQIFDIAGRMVYEMTVGESLVPSRSSVPETTPRETIIWQPAISLGSGVYLVRVGVWDNNGLQPIVTKRVVYLK